LNVSATIIARYIIPFIPTVDKDFHKRLYQMINKELTDHLFALFNFQLLLSFINYRQQFLPIKPGNK